MIPQIIFKSLKEFLFLLNEMEALGYRAIDLNMGCPFPLQARHGRGSGLLAHPDIVAEVADIIKARPELTFSVKMRLGWENTEEWTPILDILNDTPLAHIALHPRTGTQQYKGSIHREIFERVYETCRHPLLYNGDLTTLEQLHAIEKCYPRLAGLMIGRGLLARPTLAREYAERREWSHEEHIHTLRLLHSKLKEEYARIVKGEAQLHSKLRPYWEYTEPLIGHKPHKKIMKSGNLRNYLNAIEELR
jgi:tRNA-dihydrouridine synthase